MKALKEIGWILNVLAMMMSATTFALSPYPLSLSWWESAATVGMGASPFTLAMLAPEEGTWVTRATYLTNVFVILAGIDSFFNIFNGVPDQNINDRLMIFLSVIAMFNIGHLVAKRARMS